jgi:hypothetical protein
MGPPHFGHFGVDSSKNRFLSHFWKFTKISMMKTLDLHGIRHKDVPRQVENFVLTNDTPMRIIIGNSGTMFSFGGGVKPLHSEGMFAL